MNDAGFLLINSAKNLKYNMSLALSHYKITAAQWAVLKHLDILEESGASPNSRRAVHLADKLCFDKPTMSGIVSRLRFKQLLEEQRDPTDGRVRLLSLTSAAKELLPVLTEIGQQVTNDYLGELTEEERQQLIALLTKLQETRDDHE